MRLCSPGLRHPWRCICACFHCINVNKFFKCCDRCACACSWQKNSEVEFPQLSLLVRDRAVCFKSPKKDWQLNFLSLTPFLHITHVVISCSPRQGLQAMQWLLLWIFPRELFNRPLLQQQSSSESAGTVLSHNPTPSPSHGGFRLGLWLATSPLGWDGNHPKPLSALCAFQSPKRIENKVTTARVTVSFWVPSAPYNLVKSSTLWTNCSEEQKVIRCP